MSIYLIDFENTHAAGLNGITRLSPQDLVVFLGAKDKTIPVDLVTQLTGPKVVASVEWKKANGSTPNYLDFQLVSYLALLITNPQVHENHYVIVTKDAGFDSAIDFWATRLKNISLERRPSISVTQNTQNGERCEECQESSCGRQKTRGDTRAAEEKGARGGERFRIEAPALHCDLQRYAYGTNSS